MISALAQEVDEDENPYRPGLVARYSGADGARHSRLEPELAHAWNSNPPDRRLPPGPFTARYQGRLWVQSPGEHRLRVYAAGAVRLSLAGKLLIDAHAPEPAWLDAAPVDLPFGFHPLEIEYRRNDENARLSLYWQGPQFGLEPVAARWLLHDAGQTPPDDFERGEQLVRALRCAACHDLPGEPDAIRAPALDALAGNLSRAWFIEWLSTADSTAGRRMPHFGYTADEAAAMADTLLAASLPLAAQPEDRPAKSPKRKRKDAADEPPPPSVAAGQTLFRTTGCLACHRVGELGSDGLFGGGDLAHVADKRPADFFARWLARPESVNRDHRMPVFASADHELASLSLYLESLGGSRTSVTKTADGSHDGVRLIREGRCSACHTLPRSLEMPAAPKRTKLAAAAVARAQDNCLGEPEGARHRPGFRLDERERRAIEAFVAGIQRVPDAPVVHTGRQILSEHNCLACHARGSSPGLAARLPALGDADVSLRDRLPALQPPALFGVGDKLHDEALNAAIRAPERRRPWLDVRMPKYALADDEATALVAYFVETDRIPPHDDVPSPDATASHPASALDAAGPRLVTADGFGCTSCHAIGEWAPQKVALNAHGADLSQLGQRIRREWFERWVRNPARIVPQMEMPAVQQSIRGVLDRDLDAQLAAVWHVLNRPGFTPPAPGALRVVRRSNLPNVREPAAVLTDVIEAGGRGFVKPFVLGFENRHNLLVDLASNRLAAWWIGDTAREQTRGKSWYWEAGVPQLLPPDRGGEGPGDLVLVDGDERIAPQAHGQYLTELDGWEHLDAGVRFSHRLHFPRDGKTHTVRVVQEFAPLAADEHGSGFRRRVSLERTPADARFELIVLAGDVAVADDGHSARLAVPAGAVRVALVARPSQRLVRTPGGASIMLAAAGCELEYRAAAQPDQFLPLPEVDRAVERAELPVVPGFEAVRLPVTDEAMPTALAWRPDGTLVVSSLEGRVWLGHDTDDDGLEEKLVPFSDELAAPYGVATAGEAIDVVNKFGLVRLFDANRDGRAERSELLASGWGHTRDYHDWAVGLPRGRDGSYYVSFGCQRDDRAETEAHLRGKVARLVPREPTDDDPRRYTVEEIAGGFRYPQGIALSRAGDLFVTDQQGNYTPFNELNHVLPGERYGFINSLELARGLDPPFRPAAVEIPHPWTRSVNGIAFLDTPEAVRDKLGRDLFGPFEGQLVGCEYTNRRLVRMSLERVGGDFQGAVYPLSLEPAAGIETFEGPLVCAIAPDGDLYVGNIHDSGWGAGANTGSLVRIRPQGDLPPGIAEIRAAREGFAIRFTRPVDRAKASDPAGYAVSSFRRIPTPAYGGDDVDRRQETIRAVRVADDAASATIELGELREGVVYEFHLRDLSDGGQRFFPDQAFYTLRRRAQ
jgi:cbb3-type cytochrome oxidase cytochrome c subunit